MREKKTKAARCFQIIRQFYKFSFYNSLIYSGVCICAWTVHFSSDQDLIHSTGSADYLICIAQINQYLDAICIRIAKTPFKNPFKSCLRLQHLTLNHEKSPSSPPPPHGELRHDISYRRTGTDNSIILQTD